MQIIDTISSSERVFSVYFAFIFPKYNIYNYSVLSDWTYFSYRHSIVDLFDFWSFYLTFKQLVALKLFFSTWDKFVIEFF